MILPKSDAPEEGKLFHRDVDAASGTGNAELPLDRRSWPIGEAPVESRFVSANVALGRLLRGCLLDIPANIITSSSPSPSSLGGGTWLPEDGACGVGNTVVTVALAGLGDLPTVARRSERAVPGVNENSQQSGRS